MPRTDPKTLQAIAPIAAEQDGFVTAAQAAQVGIAYSGLTHLVNDEYLERVGHGVYRVVVGVPAISRVPEWLYVKYLELDGKRLPWNDRSAPRVVASHETAADALEIGALPVDVASFTSTKRRTTTLPAVVLRTASLPADDWTYLFDGRLPVTRASRTIVDLALVGVGHDYVERAISDALRRGLTSTDEIAGVLDRRRRSARKASVAWLDARLKRASR